MLNHLSYKSKVSPGKSSSEVSKLLMLMLQCVMYICYYLLLQLLVTRSDEVQAKLRALKEAARCTKLGCANLPTTID